MNNFGTRFKKKNRINFMKIIMAKTVENHLNYYNFLLKRKKRFQPSHTSYICMCVYD